MRTAVIRVNVDPDGRLTAATLSEKISALTAAAKKSGIAVSAPGVEMVAPERREIQILIEGDDPTVMNSTALRLCTEFFGESVRPGPVTYISRGTDDDAHGVLAGFGITGEVERSGGAAGFDTLTVRLSHADLERIPESRIQTALEAATNCEIVIVTR